MWTFPIRASVHLIQNGLALGIWVNEHSNLSQNQQKNKYFFSTSHAGLVMISSLMIITSMAMFTFPKHLKGSRIPAPGKIQEIEAEKKLKKQVEEEESKPQLKGLQTNIFSHLLTGLFRSSFPPSSV